MPETADHRHHLLALEGLAGDELISLLDQARRFHTAAGSAPPTSLLAGRAVANLFFEDSTRTRCSFTIAAKRLGALTIDLTGAGSSLSKGESFLDTARTIEAMGIDVMIIRSRACGTPAMIAHAVRCAVINAGDGRHEHPTQGLLDLYTLRECWGDFAGRTIAIVGDIANSRVARSNIHGLTTLGTEVLLVGPPTLVPRSLERIALGPGRVSVSHDLDAVLPRVDAIMMLRVQLERILGGALADDYRTLYRLTAQRAERLRPDVPVLHPGPMNRGVEIDSEVADDPQRSVILRQVANGVALRMAVLARSVGAS